MSRRILITPGPSIDIFPDFFCQFSIHNHFDKKYSLLTPGQRGARGAAVEAVARRQPRHRGWQEELEAALPHLHLHRGQDEGLLRHGHQGNENICLKPDSNQLQFHLKLDTSQFFTAHCLPLCKNGQMDTLCPACLMMLCLVLESYKMMSGVTILLSAYQLIQNSTIL